MDGDESRLRLEASTSGLAERVPLMSARRLVSAGQSISLIVLAVLFAIGLVISARDTMTALITLATLTYVVVILYRARLYVRSTRSDVVEIVTDEEALEVAAEDLPFYTVLIPVYREASVVTNLVEHVARLDYPIERLEVLILAEADDEETINALLGADPGPQFELVVIPAAEPRTKPKALNFGLTLARGELVAVYDAEDEPDTLQLRRSAVALNRFGPEVACLQAKLSYSNVEQNLITRWFTIEYAMWFSFFLPGLASLHAPIPLGGTSNHFRRTALRALGGWDPYNVTEDADLGIRMFREKYTIKILESITLEEANSDFVNWVKQRSRWYKGYLQTFMIHFRSPRLLRREMGWKGTLNFAIFVGGTPILSALNPIFWALTIVWFAAHPVFLQEIYPAPVYYVSLAVWVFGNFLFIYLTLLSARHVHGGQLLLAALFVPLYWVMMAIAAFKALFQLIFTPSYWEKTAHGLGPDDKTQPVPVRVS
jgi:cellulose synthase/poly-beta-1,6-N-acetylglucosamine synthase-like glycosyltransferase